jgi:hypothetical protein
MAEILGDLMSRFFRGDWGRTFGGGRSPFVSVEVYPPLEKTVEDFQASRRPNLPGAEKVRPTRTIAKRIQVDPHAYPMFFDQRFIVEPSFAAKHFPGTPLSPVYPRKRLPLSGSKPLPSIGFLTVCDHAEQGLFGGLLLLNANGRPLEFHCTAPLRTNRAQEILYGPTLRRYLYGEILGPALLGKLKVEPLLLCTDQREALASREFHSIPTLLVVSPGARLATSVTAATSSANTSSAATSSANTGGTNTSDAANAAATADANAVAETAARDAAARDTAADASAVHDLIQFKLGKNTVAVEAAWERDQNESRQRWEPFVGRIDLAEPFTRIRDAIDEARKAA